MTDASAPSRPDTERTVVYPSGAVPAVPSFVVTAPAGWSVDEAAGSLLVLRSPAQPDGQSLDATVRHKRVAGEVTLEDAAKTSWARIERARPDARLSFERVASFGPTVAFLRGYSWGTSNGAATAELHAVLLAPRGEGRTTADLFQMAITGPAEAVRHHGDAFVEAVASFRFV